MAENTGSERQRREVLVPMAGLLPASVFAGMGWSIYCQFGIPQSISSWEKWGSFEPEQIRPSIWDSMI